MYRYGFASRRKEYAIDLTDISIPTVLSYRLDAEGFAGACVPALMDDGQRMVAILNPDNEAILFGFGKAPV